LEDLANRRPYASCFLNLVSYGLDVLVVLGEDLPEITEQLYLFQNFPFYLKELSEGHCGCYGRVSLRAKFHPYLAYLGGGMTWVAWVALHGAPLTMWGGPLSRDLHEVLWV
jgi:hypothetical protein